MNNANFKDYLEGYKNITERMIGLNVEEARKRLAEIPGEIETWEEVLGEDTIEGKTPEEAAAARANSEAAVAEISTLLAEQAEMERVVEEYRTLDNYRSNIESNFHNYHHSTRDTFEQGKAAIESKLAGIATKGGIQSKLDGIDAQIAEFNSEYREASRELYAMKEFKLPTIANPEVEEELEQAIEEVEKAEETSKDIEVEAAKVEEENKKTADELAERLERIKEEAKENLENGEVRWARGYTEEQVMDAMERGIDAPVGPEYEQWLLETVPLGDVNEPGVLFKKIEQAKAPEIRWAAGYTEEQILDAIERGIDKPDGPEYEQWLKEVVPLGDVNEPGVLYTGEPFEPTPPTKGDDNTPPPGDGDGGDGGDDTPPSDDEDKDLGDDTPPIPPTGDDEETPTEDEEEEKKDEEDKAVEEKPEYQPNFTEDAPGINIFQKNTNSKGARQVIKKRKASIIRTAGIGIAGVIAANALWGVPIATAALAGAIIVGGTQFAREAERVIKEKIQTARLRGLADDISSEEYDVRTVYDYAAGTVDFAKATVKEDGTIEYEPIRNAEELYKVAEAAGMTRDELDKKFAKATSARWSRTPGVTAEGLDVVSISNNGLAGLYDQAGGIKITNPQERDESIRHITERGISKVENNVNNLTNVLENKDSYNLSEEQEALIKEAITKQEAIIARKGLRKSLVKGKVGQAVFDVGTILSYVGLIKPISKLGDKLEEKGKQIMEGEPETIETTATELPDEETEVELTEEEKTMIEERKKAVEEAMAEEAAKKAEEGTDGSDSTEGSDVAEEVEETEEIEVTTSAPTGEGTTGTDAEEQAKEDRFEEDIFEDDLSVEAPQFTPLTETVEHVERPEQTSGPNIPDRAKFVEQLAGCPDNMLDIVVQAMREKGVSEEEITGLLTEAGRMPAQENGMSMGM